MKKWYVSKQYAGCLADNIYEGTYEECLKEFNFYKHMFSDAICDYKDTNDYVCITLGWYEYDNNGFIDGDEIDCFYYKETY